jgi:heterodisulfide reductase subunit C
MDIEEVYREKEKRDVQSAACLDCGTCVESCASNRTLSLRWFGLKLVESSRRLALGLKRSKP